MSVVLARGKGRYIDGLTRFRGDDVSPWIEQFAGAVARAAGLAILYVNTVRMMLDQWRAMVLETAGDLRGDATVWRIIDYLPGQPVVTAPMLAAAIGRSEPALYGAIQVLERAGVLVQMSQGSRNRVWQASGLLELIEGLEDGQLTT